jgi:hypothetical protein
MEVLNLFWNLDVNDTTKYALLILVSIFIMSFVCGVAKNPNMNIKPNSNYKSNESNIKLTKCQIDYKMCQANMDNGNLDKKNDMCFVCTKDGEYPKVVNHPRVGIINLDPTSGELVG